jgi:hypothetical protein
MCSSSSSDILSYSNKLMHHASDNTQYTIASCSRAVDIAVRLAAEHVLTTAILFDHCCYCCCCVQSAVESTTALA